MLKLKELREIGSTIAKKKFVYDNRHDREFIKCLKFILDDLIITNISSKKYSKLILAEPTYIIKDVDDFLEYISSSSGKDKDIVNIKHFVNQFVGDEHEILSGMVCKNYSVFFGIKYYNEAMKGIDSIKESGYMGCQPFDEKKVRKLFEENDELISQVKADGQYLNSVLTDCNVTMTARSGIQQFLNGPLVEELKTLRTFLDDDMVLTGELLIKGYDRKTANGLIGALISSNEKIMNGDEKEADKFLAKRGISIEELEERLTYSVWDIITLNGFKEHLDETIYSERLFTLNDLIERSNAQYISINEYRYVRTYEEAIGHFKELLDRGEEGSVLKGLNEVWKDGKPAYQIKMKMEMNIELKIVGFNIGKEKTKYEKTLGSLQVESEDGLLSTNMSGINDNMRDEFWLNKSNYLGKIVTVKCNGISYNREGGVSLLYPNFIEVRNDKTVADTLEQIREIEKSVITLKNEKL